MSSVQSLRQFISERLTAAAGEIFTEFEKTIVQYEEEIDRQRRLLDISWKPQINLHRIELPHRYVWKEKEVLTKQQLWNQERNSTLDQEEPELPREECVSPQQEPERPQEEPELPQEEPKPPQKEPDLPQEEPEPPQKEPDLPQEEPGSPQQEPERPQEESELPQEEELCIRQDEEQLLPKQETDRFTLTPDHEERNNLEPEPNVEHLLSQNAPGAENQDREESRNEDPGRSRDGELKQVKRTPRTRGRRDNVGRPKLKRHTDTRTAKKVFSCQTCGKSYGYRKTLKIHIRTHTGERPYRCQTCGKKFGDRKTLKSHMRTHTGERPYPCEICGKHFSQRGNLITHMRAHAGEKPFCCQTCEKSFITKPVLIKHMRTHTGEKPYQCQTCARRFSQKGNLIRHMRTHRR
ncbi:zinc finger protein 768-like [Kryptolebias marmoratus]|uniref:Zinc finger protein 768-like n=1 Tax=Kryptolebias marmoratus TaxID=37003 RepID=A0A3Q3AC63_KRYMA|nr:zinc finger protein 768-like [Kryptolebias marmoratus]